MSSLTKRVLLIIIGVLAGLTTWPFTELLVNNQQSFSSFFIFSISQGGVFGLIIGIFFGAFEGITSKNNRTLIFGTVTGAVIGILGGAIGAIISQRVLFIIGDNLFTSYTLREGMALPISRAVSFGILGIFIGIIEGIRARSSKKVLVGFIGGLTGGLIGGLAIEILNIISPDQTLSRLLGLTIFTVLIGLFYGLIERSMASGVLQVLNGDLKRREYLINQKKLVVGSDTRCDITLENYNLLDNKHAVITEERGEVVIRSSSPETKLLVNDKEVDKQILKYEDVIKLGDVKMFYKHK